MKQLLLFKSPRKISYSENDINLGFHLSQFNVNSQVRDRLAVEIHIEDGDFGSGDFKLRKRINKSFDAKGLSTFSISNYLKPYLEQEYPDINQVGIYSAHKASRRYKVFAFFFNNFSASEKIEVFDGVVVKGGIEREFEEQINPYLDLMVTNQQALSNHTGLEVVKHDQNFILSIMADDVVWPFDGQFFLLRIKDSAGVLLNQGYVLGDIKHGSVFHFVINLKAYDIVISEKKQLTIEIAQTIQETTPVILTKTIVTHHVIAIPDTLVAEDTVLHYENSLGGISSVLFSAESKHLDYESSLIEVADTKAYLSASVLKASQKIYNPKRSLDKKVETGFIGVERVLSYQDLFLSPNVFIEQKVNASYSSFLNPFTIKGSDIELFKVGDEVANLSVKVNAQPTGLYTKRMEDVVADVCNQPLFLNVFQGEYNTATAIYQLPEGVNSGEIRYGLANNVNDDDNEVVQVSGNSGTVNLPLDNVVSQTDMTPQNVYFWIRSKCGDGFSAYVSNWPLVKLSIAGLLEIEDIFTTVTYSDDYQPLYFDGEQDIQRFIVNPNPWGNPYYFTNIPSSGHLLGNKGGKLRRNVGTISPPYPFLLSYKPEITSGVETIAFEVGPNSGLNSEMTGTSTSTQANLYIEVKPAVYEEGYSGPVFIKLVEISTEETTQTSPVGAGLRIYEKIFANCRLEFYSDPYGINPLNLDQSSIVIHYNAVYKDLINATTTVNNFETVAGGTYRNLQKILKDRKEYLLLPGMEQPTLEEHVTGEFQILESPEYSII